MSKTPEEMAEDWSKKRTKQETGYYDMWLVNEWKLAREAFLAGYKAAQEQLADVSKVMPDTCEHILDMSKMVDVNGWISVKDRLPEKEGEYLAFGYSASDAARWIVVMYDPKDECWYELSSDWDWTDDVTHWQELPEPPKEEE